MNLGHDVYAIDDDRCVVRIDGFARSDGVTGETIFVDCGINILGA